jgi:hypothetical protein
MKQIIRKEIREQLKVAVPALIVLSLTLIYGFHSCVNVAKRTL